MTRNITTSFRRSAEASFSDEVDLCFLTLSHDQLDEPIRVVWDTHDFYYGTETFIGFPFDVSILSDDETPPTAQLTIQNVDPRIGETIRRLSSPPRLKIELSLSSDFSYALLLHCDGAGGSTSFPDSGGNNQTVSAIGSAHVSSTTKIFGSGTVRFNGTTDWLEVAADPSQVLTTNDFTIDFRFNLNFLDDNSDYVFYDSGTAQIEIWIPPATYHNIRDETNTAITDESLSTLTDGDTRTLAVFGDNINANKIQGTTQINADTEYHVEVTRKNGVLRMFLDGTQEADEYLDVTGFTDDIVDYTDDDPFFGANFFGGELVDGVMDEIRIINGAAAHTEDFNPPLAPYVPSFAAAPDIIYSADKLFLINVSVDVMQITGQIVGWDYLQRVWPGPRAMQAVFPGLFR